MLLDTGSRNFPAAAMIENVVGKWLTRNHRKQIELIVAHSHPHSDHVAGDEQLKNLRSAAITIRFVPATVEDSKKLYGLTRWPDEIGSVDLGGRVLDAVAIPGHSPVSIALYDRRTAILFTGDSLYPGRLYIGDWNNFVQSTQRLVDFTKDKLVAHILGDLLELNEALAGLHGVPTRRAMRDFSIWPVSADSQPNSKTKEKFEAYRNEQIQHMWDQPRTQ